jgi:anti-sigma28 factor (negative regulator of flagellin synthesis)
MRVTDTSGSGMEANRVGAGRTEPNQAQGTGATGRTELRGAPDGGTSKAGEDTAGRDRLQLSALASQLRAEDVESPERTAQIDRLAAEYAAGRYKADAGEISSKLIDEALGK